jgi:ribosomal protein S18 acetylase RimI-like enzyme
MKFEFSIVEFCDDLSCREDLYALLVKLDESYIPPISSRVNLKEYSVKLLKNGKVFCAKTSKDGYVGVLAIYINDFVDNKAFISSIGVLPEYYGAGVSENLLSKACEVAIEYGMKSISLEVSVENQRAIVFYTKHGFYEELRMSNNLFMKKEFPSVTGK